jgi:hypothetical protein
MKDEIIEKITELSDTLNAMEEHKNILKNEVNKVQVQIERKKGAILAMKELLESIEAKELQEQANEEKEDLIAQKQIEF